MVADVSGRLAAVMALLAGSLLAFSYWVFFVRPERAAEHAQKQAPETLVLISASGGVEVAGPDGRWRPAHPGEQLAAHDRIRTDEEGDAELRAADGSTVRLSPATEARVDELRRELKRLHLDSGQLTADVRDDPTRVFEVELDGKGGVARTRGARFTAAADGAGGAAVASHRGEVTLSAKGKEVVIRSGQFARLGKAGTPDDAQALPQSLFLKVLWPPDVNNTRQVTVAGTTAPNSRIKVDDHYVRVNPDGTYQATIDLQDGVHQLRVRASDVAGHVVDEKSPRIVIDTKTDFKVHSPKWK